MTPDIVHPGVYLEELPVALHPIEGVPTSVAAFVGRTSRGPVGAPVLIASFQEFEARFGGLWQESPLSFAIQQYFLNGGREAQVVRVQKRGATATVQLALDHDVTGWLELSASNPGSWGAAITVTITHHSPTVSARHFNLTLHDTATGVTEQFLHLSCSTGDPRFVKSVLSRESTLARVKSKVRPRAETRRLRARTNFPCNSLTRKRAH